MSIYTVYLTINNINDHFYFGVHKTNNPEDSYLGSGKALKRAVCKYGENNFTKHVLFKYTDSESAYLMESILVTEKTIKNPNCYNMKLGGNGGFDFIRNSESYTTTRIIKLKESRNKQPDIRPVVDVTCMHCNIEFNAKVTSVYSRKFCSRKCSTRYSNNQKHLAALTPNTICAYCGTAIRRYPCDLKQYPRHFCNKHCSGKFKHIK